MNSGKTLQMLAVKHNYDLVNYHTYILAPTVDTRSGKGWVSSRVAGMKEPCYAFGKNDTVESVLSIFPLPKNNDTIIMVDECQFLLPSQVDDLANVVDRYNVPVLAYGLKTDFTGKLFDASKRFLELADDIREVKTICEYCGRKATCNMLTENGKPCFSGDQIRIGDSEYHAVCRKCFNKFKEGAILK